ncbi:cytochrome c oxidase accessory protein CcoG [Haloferula sp. BvORR071]|uniref:cytochrome c oxidase accessory protein CcoG n=1 Tax=Haloferula sp. BvORR071 TaxID=1396141 RepID=UPI000554FEFB|nr:cytochrome c oxidase accessory protein CcoG [Haloferula sp. BvORR071]
MASDLRKQPNLDSVTTINSDGSRYYIHTADVKGKWTRGRRVTAVLLIAVYVLLPWLQINGSPALFFDLENNHFHVFGLTLVPQDLWVMFFGITGLGFTLFFVTALLGRLWCGWACPYTVFLDHVFRRIERWTEGDAVARRRLDTAPWSAGKLLRRGTKHALYFICSALIAHVFLSYFVSIPRLYQHMQEGPLAHATAFGTVLFLTLILWFCFGWFREQFCVIMCPYGRLQSALTDDDTVAIGYDAKRGEPRGPKGKAEGACIDCRRCVNVCPTGIDIRNGLQLECIGCAACIDACDDVMTLIDRPKGLVRYDSQNGLQGKPRKILRPRVLVYTAMGMLGFTVFTITAWQRAKPFTADFTRMRGQPYYSDSTTVRNHYQVRIHNKRNQPASFTLQLRDAPPGFTLSGAGETVQIPPRGEAGKPAIILAPQADYTGPVTLKLEARMQPGDVVLTHELRFLGPSTTSQP